MINGIAHPRTDSGAWCHFRHNIPCKVNVGSWERIALGNPFLFRREMHLSSGHQEGYFSELKMSLDTLLGTNA